MNSVYEDRKGFAFITRKGTHFTSYWSNVDKEWSFVNLDTKTIDVRCERNEWNTTVDYIKKHL